MGTKKMWLPHVRRNAGGRTTPAGVSYRRRPGGRLNIVWAGVALALLAASCKPPVIVEVPASDLEVRLLVSDPEPRPPSGRVLIAMEFVLDGKWVRLGPNISVSCNGTPLPDSTLGNMAWVTIVPAGGSYSCTYEFEGTTTTFEIPVAQRPQITSPSSQESISRSANVVIAYVPLPDTSIQMEGTASGKTATGRAGCGAGLQPNDGTYEGLDVVSGQCAVDPGAGSLSLHFTQLSSIEGTGFQSVRLTYVSGATIAITWE